MDSRVSAAKVVVRRATIALAVATIVRAVDTVLARLCLAVPVAAVEQGTAIITPDVHGQLSAFRRPLYQTTVGGRLADTHLDVLIVAPRGAVTFTAISLACSASVAQLCALSIPLLGAARRPLQTDTGLSLCVDTSNFVVRKTTGFLTLTAIVRT